MEINKIYNEDCLETMARMPENFIDIIITSPPYNKAGYEGKIRKRHKNDTWTARNIDYDNNSHNDFIKESDYQKNQIKVLNEMKRVLKCDGSVFYNHKVRVANHKASHPIEWIIQSDLNFRQQIVWNRKSSPAVSPIRFLPTTELIFWLTKTNVQPNFLRNKNLNFVGEVWDITPKPNNLHPAPFPDILPANILKCINEKKDIIVYDPYSGIGTTCIVAHDFGFNFVGSEISKNYIDIFKERFKQNKKQTTLF